MPHDPFEASRNLARHYQIEAIKVADKKPHDPKCLRKKWLIDTDLNNNDNVVRVYCDNCDTGFVITL